MKNLSKALLVLVFLAGITNCENFNYSENEATRRSAGADGNIDLDALTNVDALRDSVDANSFLSGNSESCHNYDSGITSFKLFNSSGNPFALLENCIFKATDEVVVPLCEREGKLLEARRDYEDDDDAIDQIDHALVAIEETKDEIADVLFEASDAVYEAADELYDAVDDATNVRIFQNVLRLVIKSEVESSAKAYERKTNNICQGGLVTKILKN